jgi:FkbM family methyltransferase
MMRPRRFARFLLNRASRTLSFDTAMLISKQLLAGQGFGGDSGNIAVSGELCVFNRVATTNPVLFDVGGHVGEYTREFFNKFPGGRSFIFEPSASHLEVLRQNLGEHPGVTICPFGLGAEAADLPLYKDQNISGLASLTQRRLDHINVKMEVAETVSIRTLDSYVAQTGVASIDLLKMDVEGHEFSVLNGATIAMDRRLIKLVQFEFGGCNLDTHTTLQDFFYFFKNYDFLIGLVQPQGRVQLIDHYDEFYEQYRTANFVAAPRAVLAV